MKISLQKVLLLSAAFIVIAGCKKDEGKNVVINGTYRGGFSETNLTVNQADSVVSSGNVQVMFQSDKFSTATTGEFLTVGDGTFEIQASRIVFHDVDEFPANTTFNSNAALHDSYTFQTKGDSLFLTRYLFTPRGTYSQIYNYKLKKQ